MRSVLMSVMFMLAAVAMADVPQERVRFEADSCAFVAGDTIRFRATLEPTVGSKYLYVELIDPFGNVGRRVKVKENNGAFEGYLPLDRELAESTYTLAAYTMYMQNRGDVGFFKMPVEVRSIYSYKYRLEPEFAGNSMTVRLSEVESGEPVRSESLLLYGPKGLIMDAGRKKSQFRFRLPSDVATVKVKFDNFEKFIAVPVDSTAARVEFYPEGGALVAGESNAVAIRATDPDGRPMVLTGEIAESGGGQTVEFRTDSTGLARVYLYPVEGRSYEARVGRRRFALPGVRGDAAALQAVHRGDKSVIDLRGPKPDGAVVEGNVEGVTHFVVPVERLPVSISPEAPIDLTLLGAGGEVLSWRTVSADAEADTELLTRGAEARQTDAYPVEIGGEISGVIKSRWRGKPLKNARINIIAPEIGFATTAPTDSAGRFCVNGLDWPDGTMFAFTAVNANGNREHNFEITHDAFPSVRPLPLLLSANRYEPMSGDAMLRSGIQLNEIQVTARRTPEEQMQVMKAAMGVRTIDQSAIKDRHITTYEEALRNIPGLRVEGGRILSNRRNSIYGGNASVEIWIDGMQWIPSGFSSSTALTTTNTKYTAPKLMSGTGKMFGGLMVGNIATNAAREVRAQVAQMNELSSAYPFDMVESIEYVPSVSALVVSNTAAMGGGALVITTKSGKSANGNDSNLFIHVYSPLGYLKKIKE